MEACVGVVQGIVDLVDDAGAHAAEGGEFLVAEHQHLVFLDFLEGDLEVPVHVRHFPAEAAHQDLVLKPQPEFCGGEGFG